MHSCCGDPQWEMHSFLVGLCVGGSLLREGKVCSSFGVSPCLDHPSLLQDPAVWTHVGDRGEADGA